MADCLPIGAMNPFNEALIAIFGANFYPPYNTGFQPSNLQNLVNEKLLQMQIPGGGKVKPTGDPNMKHIKDFLTTITGPLGALFSTFGPLFLILDLIRAILDIVCALFNPVPVISSLIDLFLNVIPPILALFPPIASALLALNVIKLVIAILIAILSTIIPIIDQILECANAIATSIATGDLAAIAGCAQKICQLLAAFLNEIGAFTPISFILELLDLFMNLGAKFFCAAEADCCNDDNCPPILKSPPSGTGTILSSDPGFNLEDVGGPDFQIIAPTTIISDPSHPELGQLLPYIFEPSSASQPGKTTIRAQVGSDTYDVYTASNGQFGIRAGGFTVGSSVSYEIQPEEMELVKANIIGLGCLDDVQVATQAVQQQALGDTGDGSGAPSGTPGGGFNPFEPLSSAVGTFPKPDVLVGQLTVLHGILTADPTTDIRGDVNAVANAYLAQVTDFYKGLACASASRTSSTFEASKLYASADGNDVVQLVMQVNEKNGANLLDANIPNTGISAQFVTSHGTVTDAIFDAADARFKATITATEPGIASITALFLVDNQVCMSPATITASSFDGVTLIPPTIIDKVINIQFVEASGKYPRRRRENQYVQSAGGRRRV